MIHLDLPYKGERDYIHGTSIYNAIIEHIPESIRFGMSLWKWAQKPLDLHFGERHLHSLSSPNVTFTAKTGEWQYGCLTERDGEVTRRIPYDENAIRGSLMGYGITLTDTAGYTPIEVAVGLTKQLHIALFGPSQWAFTNLDITLPLSVRAIRFCDRLPGKMSKFTKSEILGENGCIGTINFARVDGKW